MGDRVLLSTANLSLKMTGATKLMPKFVCPFSIVKKVNYVAYQLDLPATMKVHNVFHVSLLKPYVEDPARVTCLHHRSLLTVKNFTSWTAFCGTVRNDVATTSRLSS